jgi:tetratricopeptide (TPR) repeat protein
VAINLSAFYDFREGLAKLRDGDAAKATELLRQAVDRDPENPYYISYYGLSLAEAENKWAEAEQLCHTAVCRNRRQAQLYLNLAEVYVKSGKRQGAADTLSRGLRYLPHDVRLNRAFGRLCIRRAPVLKFLPRASAVNRGLGRVRHQLMHIFPWRRQLPGPEADAGAPPLSHRTPTAS